MAVHNFYLSWQTEYDYNHSEELTEQREKLLQFLRENGYDSIYFFDFYSSEKYLHDSHGKTLKIEEKNHE